ncbi:Gfo/Idh/MocA family oxidoreductase [Amycolatopsis endophytica]|uniref:Putative dehydrogenase n=1 Tax=Amycolatopsis endophytica TaxID=860233 RepID=A0A853BCD8_9PSEU|nr:Gfo/Idh/MocA family oxidoreductase [Amycolatopsis endophytica]NYI92445.1 putative dehydrogenase [Amycolatopsis endophytica]
MEPLRIGILGAARIAATAIVAPAHDTGHRLVAIAARDRGRAEAFAAQHGVERVAASYADLLADDEIDVVYNPLPNGLHGRWNLAAVRAGKHVLTEKPFAANAAEAREVTAAAAAAGVRVVEAFHYHYHPVLLRLHELLDSGELGELRSAKAELLIPAPAETDPRWSFDLAGGALMDVGCYGLHAVRGLAPWAGGAPVLESASGTVRAGHPGVDETMDARLTFPGGATATMRCDMAAAEVRFALRLTGTRGEATAVNFVRPDTDDRLLVGDRVEHPGRRPSYSYQLAAFAAHLREGAPPRDDPADTVATMTLIDDCYRAAGFPLRPRA